MNPKLMKMWCEINNILMIILWNVWQQWKEPMAVSPFLFLANKNSRTNVANVLAELANKKWLMKLCDCETNVKITNITSVGAGQYKRYMLQRCERPCADDCAVKAWTKSTSNTLQMSEQNHARKDWHNTSSYTGCIIWLFRIAVDIKTCCNIRDSLT